MSFRIILVLSIIATVLGDVVIDDKCAHQEKCVDSKLTEIIEKFDQEERIPLFGGLELVKTPNVEPVNVERAGDEHLVDKLKKFAVTHDFAFRTVEEDEDDERNIGEEEARTSRLKKLMIPLILALKLKMALVLPVVLTAIALIAIKGVFAGLFAIFLSGLTALKSIGDSKQDRVTAIVAAPVPEGLHHHPWSRVGAAQEAAAAAAAANQAQVLQQAQAAIDPYAGQYGAYQYSGIQAKKH